LIDFEETLQRFDKETTFYVTEDVLAEFRRRVREQQHVQDQGRKRREGPAQEQGNEPEEKRTKERDRGSNQEM
jgi:hypothetical protein